MKSLFIAAGLLVFLQAAHAQYGYARGMYKTKRLTFSVNAGLGIPTSDFAKGGRTDTSHAVGFANPGFRFEISASYLLLDYLGIMVTLHNTLNSFNVGAYTQAYNVPDSFSVTAQGNHYIAEYLAGPFLNLPVNDKLSFELRTLVGLVSASYPDIIILPNNLNNPTTQEFKYAHAQNFGFNISAAGKEMVDKNAAVLLTVGYTSSNIVYPGGLFSITTPPILKSQIPRTYTGFSFTNMDMQLGIISITLGVAICF